MDADGRAGAKPHRPRVLVRGGGDIATAVAQRLHGAGWAVLVVEDPVPRVVRLRMAFAAAVLDGEAVVEGRRAVRVESVQEAEAVLARSMDIPVLADPAGAALGTWCPDVLVDARLRKRELPDTRVSDAPLVVGLGPGFTAGVNCHVAVETNRGPSLGRILWEGSTDPYTGQPEVIEGHGRERYLYAPVAGRFETAREIGDLVQAGEIVGRVGDAPLVAMVSGIIRGIAPSGQPVPEGRKLVEIDPRRDPARLSALSAKAWTIADSVERLLAPRRSPGGRSP